MATVPLKANLEGDMVPKVGPLLAWTNDRKWVKRTG
jgi:hypothetical protein